MKILKENFGDIYYTFDEPISAKDFFGDKLDRRAHAIGPLHLQELTQEDKNLLPPLAHNIVKRQQKYTTVTVFNIMAVILNNYLTMERIISLENLKTEIYWLKNIVESLGGYVPLHDIDKSIEDAFDVHKNVLTLSSERNVMLVGNDVKQGEINPKILKAYSLSDATMSNSLPFVMLQIYVNPVLQYFIDCAILVVVLSSHDRLEKGYYSF